MKYDAVIFDLFGTLVSYKPRDFYAQERSNLAAALEIPLQDLERALRETRLERDRGLAGGLEADIRRIGEYCGVRLDSERIETTVRMRLETYRLEPRDGAVETLSQLKSYGLRTGLISDCAGEVPRAWPDSPFASLIDVPVFSCREHCTKPDPIIYSRACQRLSIEPGRCLYIGDGASRELTGATGVGMHPILIRDEHGPGDGISREDAVGWTGDVISELTEILTFVR